MSGRYNDPIYSKGDNLCEALNGLCQICNPIDAAPVMIHSHNRDLRLANDSGVGDESKLLFNQKEKRCAISLCDEKGGGLLDFPAGKHNEWIRRAAIRRRCWKGFHRVDLPDSLFFRNFQPISPSNSPWTWPCSDFERPAGV